MRPRAKKANPTQMLARLTLAAKLLNQGATRTMVVEALTMPKPKGLGITEQQAMVAYREVLKRRRGDFEAEREFLKSEQAERLRTTIARAIGAGRYSAAASLETLLAKITGTIEPLRIKVEAEITRRDAFVAIAASMSPEELDRIVEEQAELEARTAQLALALPVITTKTNGVAS